MADIDHLERIQSLSTRSVTGIPPYPTKRSCGGRSSSYPLAELSPHPQLRATNKQSPSLFVTQIPVLSMWLVQARFSLLFAILYKTISCCSEEQLKIIKRALTQVTTGYMSNSFFSSQLDQPNKKPIQVLMRPGADLCVEVNTTETALFLDEVKRMLTI